MTKQQFRQLDYQRTAAKAVVDAFDGQPYDDGQQYRIDPGAVDGAQTGFAEAGFGEVGTRNADLDPRVDVLANVRRIQAASALPPSDSLTRTEAAPINLDVEMETGTGKTYVYIDTMFRLYARYGWSKFVVVVPSVAIREGVEATFRATADHFQERYGHRARAFVYSSQRLEKLTAFSEDRGLQVMIINTQAFTADVNAGEKLLAGKEGKTRPAGRIIFDTPDSFQSRRPIDVIAANRPILILDEPQRMEGKATTKALSYFKAPICLRYSATHKTRHDLVHRLDALDAFQQKLVKRIHVRGVTTKGLGGTTGYMYLSGFDVRVGKPPRARLSLEVANKAGEIKRKAVWAEKGDRLIDPQLSNGLSQYDGLTVADMNVSEGWLQFTTHVGEREVIRQGEIVGTDDQTEVRRVQIREAIAAHLERERLLHRRGIKVLTLFFIDEVAKYRRYDGGGEKVAGEYAAIFEEEYEAAVRDLPALDTTDEEWRAYLSRDPAATIHEGYFSIDKKGRMTDPKARKTGETKGEADDDDAYDLILRDKERLLSLDEPKRFIFSHSALREGWDNPNVFTICTLRESDNDTKRRQEVGRGLRICVDKDGVRMDKDRLGEGAVHEVNALTVVAPESYAAFTDALQAEMKDALKDRPREASADYFRRMTLRGPEGEPVPVTDAMARGIEDWLVANKFVDRARTIQPAFHDAMESRDAGTLPGADPHADADLIANADQIVALVRTVFDPTQLAKMTSGPNTVTPRLRQRNFDKEAFQALWNAINEKAVYFTRFDTERLIADAAQRLDDKLTVPEQRIEITKGAQRATVSPEQVRAGQGFKEEATPYASSPTVPVRSAVRFDLIGRIAKRTRLSRRTVGAILQRVNADTFAKFSRNPEAFIARASEHIRRVKVSLAIHDLRYEATGERYDAAIFTGDQTPVDAAKTFEAERSVFDYVVYDSTTERTFAEKLETRPEVIVYAKLPRGFTIPTPGGTYNPDWAVALEHPSTGSKQIYFVAETKASAMAEDLRPAEQQRIECAKAFFQEAGEGVRYRELSSYEEMIEAIS